MKPFWIAIVITLAGIFVVITTCMPVGPRAYRLSGLRSVVGYLSTASLVVVIWAICFRAQVEKLRFSLLSLFVLATMEAILLFAIRLLKPF
jgi:hypothetical protein